MMNRLKSKIHINEDGFTLVEIVIVILVIGILAAIATPIYINSQNEARIAAVKTDLRNASEFLENRFTAETGYPTSLDGTSVSDGNTINLYGGGKTSSSTDSTTGTTGYGNTGNNKPADDRALTIEEFNEFNKANTGTPYVTFSNETNASFGGNKYSSMFIYEASTITSLSEMESVFYNVCSYVKGQTIDGYEKPLPATNYGLNNCYSYTSNASEAQKELSREEITVVGDFHSKATPSYIYGSSLNEVSFDSEGYYVIMVTKDVSNNHIWGGSSTQSDLTVFKITNGDTLANSSPNILCEASSSQGTATLTETTSGTQTFCGSPAITSEQTSDDFWSLNEVPEIPAGLLDDEAVAGDFGVYCIEGHNNSFSDTKEWWHISANDSLLKTGRCI